MDTVPLGLEAEPPFDVWAGGFWDTTTEEVGFKL
jgi:hypothetical protein